MSVCLALAVIYSFGYPGSTPLTSGASTTGTVLAQGTGSFADATGPPTGYVGEQQLTAPPEAASSFGTTDSLVPGRTLPGTAESPRATAGTDNSLVEALSTMERPGKGTLISPLQFLTPSSPYGTRTSPITGEHGEFHSGQDFAAPCGTRVFSADAGVVRAVGWHPWGGGNRVELDHGNGLVTTYNHLEGIAVETGDRVGAGQVIATVGTTGWSTGCHLHFETILNGAHTDPSAWKLIPMDGSGPIDMPSLVNFTPGTGSGHDGDTAWVAYLASSEPIEPITVKSPARVDAEMSAAGKRPTARTDSSATDRRSSGSIVTASPSGTPSSTPSRTPSPSGTPSTTPSPTSPTVTDPTPTPPPSKTDPTPTPPVTQDPTPTPPVTVDPTPTPPFIDPTPLPPVIVDPTPTPPVTEDPTPPVTVDPTPIPPVTVDPTPTPPVIVDPTPTPPVSDPTPSDPEPIVPEPTTAAPTATPTVSVNDPLAACDPATDPDAIVVDPVTNQPVLNPATGEPIRASELCASAAASGVTGATVTEPALPAVP